MRVIMWFRSDLRVEDNRALTAACAAATRGVVGVFVITPDQWREHDWGDPKACFVLRGVEALRESLGKLNIPLLVRVVPRFSGVSAALELVCRELAVDGLYFNKEYELNELRRDAEVAEAMEGAGVRVRQFDDQVLIQPGTLRTGEGRYYTVYTPFRKSAIARLLESPPKLAPRPRKQPAMACDSDANIEASGAGFARERSHESLWAAGEQEATRRLRSFVDKCIRTYSVDRDFPGLSGTSTLSPYLSAGMISPRQCLLAAAGANEGKLEGGAAGPATWISELLWREFYRHLIFGVPRLSMGRAFRPATEQLEWETSSEHLEAWKAGRTGVPIVDAAMRQMSETGWMHNRARMIAAMYLTKHLFISWREGERHFMQSLVDADLAQNNGGWQWAASTGTDAAPYFRIFNYESQAKRYDPQGEYVRRWVPELRDLPTQDLLLLNKMDSRKREVLDYPEPLVDHRAARERILRAFGGLRSH
jgi:deoxyribodipyrimidine photo-lyase